MTRKALLFALAALAAGCASVPDRPRPADPERAWGDRQRELAPVSAWEVRGRLALRAAEEGWNVSLYWSRQHERHRIDLSGPLGRSHLRLTRDRDGARLKDSEQNVYSAPNADELLYTTTGYSVPLAGLDYWILGLPAPGEIAGRDLDAYGRLRLLRQQDWDVEFLEYTQQDGYELPSKLYAKRRARPGEARIVGVNGPEDNAIEVRLVIDRWLIKNPG